MNVTEAIFKRRSIRRFSPQPVDKEVLYELVQAARMAPAAANIQPLQQRQQISESFSRSRRREKHHTVIFSTVLNRSSLHTVQRLDIQFL